MCTPLCSMMSLKTAAVIIVNDEISQQNDESGLSQAKFVLNELKQLNYEVSKLIVIRNDARLLCCEMQEIRKFCDIVMLVIEGQSCANVYRAITVLTAQEPCLHMALATFLKDNFKKFTENEVLLSSHAKFLHQQRTYPVVHLGRIFILNKEYLEESFRCLLKPHLQKYRQDRIYGKTIKVPKCKGTCSYDFSKLQEKNGVSVRYNENEEDFVFEVSSTDFAQLGNFEQKLQKELGSQTYETWNDMLYFPEVYSCEEFHIKNAIQTIERCLEQYGVENTFVSFNGGKDCTVLLHLILIVLEFKYSNHKKPLLCLYIRPENPFPEQDQFISQCKSYFNLNIITVQSNGKEALTNILLQHPNYKAVFMGTRRSDPHGTNLKAFNMTDSNWPQVMRCNPILDWTYSDIWDYLLYYKVPYCKLYDLGFTSLGSTINTIKNPALAYRDVFKDEEVYLPAWKLLNETKERSGRNVSTILP